MRTTYVISSMTGGGAARSLANLANHQAACGETVEILTLHQPRAADVYPLHASILRRDLSGDTPSGESMSAVIAELARLGVPPPIVAHAPVMARLRDALRDRENGVVVGVCDVTNIRLLVAAHGLPVRVIASEWADPAGYTIGPWERLRRLLYPRAGAVVCLMPEHMRFHRAYGVERLHAIANAVVAAPPRNGYRREPLIVALCRLSWEKDLRLLIDAFAEVAPRHPRWRVEIWGEGPMRPQLEKLIAARGLDPRVLLCGSTDEPYAVLARAELFALTSLNEGMPNALCEAMAAGVAPVAVDCGAGVRAIVRDGVDGVVVRSRAPEAVAAALDALMRDDVARARLAARAPEVVSRFALGRIAAQWDEVIDPGKVAKAC